MFRLDSPVEGARPRWGVFTPCRADVDCAVKLARLSHLTASIYPLVRATERRSLVFIFCATLNGTAMRPIS